MQSESEYRHCISKNPNDDYGFQGLALLYLKWAKKIRGEDESSDYINKCESVVSEGLRVVRERESLWVVSAEVQKLLGNEPSRIDKLKKAIAESKTSVIPRFLLARIYRKQGEPRKQLTSLIRS